MNRTKLHDWIESRRSITPCERLSAIDCCLAGDIFPAFFIGFSTFVEFQSTLATYCAEDRQVILGVCQQAYQDRQSVIRSNWTHLSKLH